MSIVAQPTCSCLCHSIGGVAHVTACCIPAEDVEPRPIVHGFVEMARQGRKVVATTGCGTKVSGEPDGGLISLGITPWASLTTCPPCLERIGLKEPQ